MAKENTIYIDITADTKNFEKKLNESIKYARDTGKKLDDELIVKLEADYSSLKVMEFEARLTRNRIRKEFSEGMIDRKAFEDAEKGLKRIQSETTNAGRLLESYKNTGTVGLTRLGSLFEGIKGGFASLGPALLGGGIVTGLTAITGQAITLGSSLEQAQIKFTTILGSTEQANKLISELNQFAKDTTFDTQNIRDTATQLLAVGIEAEQIIPTMKSLGDVASMLGGPDVFGRLTYAFGQVKAAGRLTGNELRQFTETGVPLLGELAKNLGKTEGEIKKMVEAGEIGFGDVVKAFETMSSEGGKFADGMSKQTETVIGKWGRLKDTFMLALTDIGVALEPFTKFMIDSFDWMFGKIGEAFAGFRIAGNIAISSIIQVFYGMQTTVLEIIGGIGSGIYSIGEWISESLNKLPLGIKESLNSGIKLIEDFLNSAQNGINNFAKTLGYNGELFKGGIKLPTISADTTLGLTQKKNSGLESIQNEINAIKEKAKANKEATQGIINDIINEREARISYNTKLNIPAGGIPLKDKPSLGAGKTQAQKKLEDEKKYQDELQKMYEDNIKEDIQLQEDKNKRIEEKEKKHQDKLKNNLDNLNKAYEKGSDIFKTQIDKAKDNIDGYIDKIKDLQAQIGKLNEDLTNLETDKITNLGDRNNEIIQKQIDLQKELNDLKTKGTNLNSNLTTETLQSMKIAGVTEVGGGTIDDLIRVAEIQKELNNLAKEKLLISQNLTEDQIKEAQRVGGLSPTEKYLEEFAIEKKKIEDQIANNNEKIKALEEQKASEEEILKVFDEKQRILDENYKNKKLEIEKQITDNLIYQNTTRIDSLKKVELQAIATAEALRNAGININTDITGVGINTAGIGSNTGTSSNTTNTVTTVVNNTFNQNINSAIDVNKVNKTVLDSMNSNNKGMSSLKIN